MAFKFSLAPVLEHRQLLEDEVQREYGQVKAVLDRAREERRNTEDGVARKIESIRHDQQAHGLNLNRRMLQEQWIEAQRHHMIDLDAQIEKLAELAEQWRLKLVEAIKARKIIEELREKEYKHYLMEEARRERNQFDEIAVREFLVEQRKKEKDAEFAERIAR